MEEHDFGVNDLSVSDVATGNAVQYSYPETTAWGRSRSQQDALTSAKLFRYRVIKRIVDLLLVAVATPILVPLLLLLALVVRVTSPGPVIFSHRRIGRNGTFFSMWKFRTMCVNSSEVLERYLAAHPEARAEWKRAHKLQNDPRVTRIGRVMRQWSLDELPQVWNVLTGRMSLVGPRPIVAAEVEKYGSCFRCYTSVKPGVTGLWQVSGRSTLSYDERVKLDCTYARHWSLLRDTKILVLTLKSVANQEGAY